MLQSQRRDRILSHLAERDFLSVGDAADLLGASLPTVRRDFRDLARDNLVQRIRGGVKLRKTDAMLPFALRQVQFSREKELLARRAAALLRPEDVVLIDGGTTTFHLGPCLPPFPLRVITNSLRLATYLETRNAAKPTLEIFLTGGFLYPNSGLLLGPGAQTALGQYHANWAFLSAGGITDAGIYNTNELVVETERVMMSHADKVVILADHSKLGRHAMCHVCPLDRIDYLITDRWDPSQPLLTRLRDAGVEVIVAEP